MLFLIFNEQYLKKLIISIKKGNLFKLPCGLFQI